MVTAHLSTALRQLSQEAPPPHPVPTRGAKSPAATSVTLQRLEALERDARGPRDELQEPGPPLLVEGLHGLPEPPDDVAVGHTVLQPSVGLPVAQVYFIQAANYQLGRVRDKLFLMRTTNIVTCAAQSQQTPGLILRARTPHSPS